MHKCLRAIGFSKYQKKRKVEILLKELEKNKTETKIIQLDQDTNLCEIRTELQNGIGVAMVGEMGEDGELNMEYYYPYLLGTHISSQAYCSIQRHTEKESYSGLLEEYRVGVSLIFYLVNSMEYIEMKRKDPDKYTENAQDISNLDVPERNSFVSSVMLTGLSVSGKVLLPVNKTVTQIENAKVAAHKRNSLIEAAKNGDEDAMESLTIEDIDLYAKVSRRVLKEDVYAIVESCFIPCGVECDQYNIIGEIIEIEELKNPMTEEEIYHMVIDCNDLSFHLGINKKDLLGEPVVGRRFKGQIWMQGIANFAEDTEEDDSEFR